MLSLNAKTRTDLSRRFEAYFSVAATDNQSRPVRVGLLTIGIVVLLLTGQSPLLLLHPAAFLASDLLFGRHNSLVRNTTKRQTLGNLRLLQAHQMVALLIFSSLSIILAFDDSIMLHRVAVLLVIAQTMNGIGIDTQSEDRAIVTVIGLAVVSQVVVFAICVKSNTDPVAQAVLHLLVAFVSAFFAYAVFMATRLRRTLEQRTEQLLVAQKGETVGRLTSGVAHDFNNLLTVMRGNLDLIEEVPEHERGPILDEVRAATDRGGDLVRQLMDRATPHSPGRTTISMDMFLSDFTAFAQRVLPANVALTTNSAPDLPVQTDPPQLEAALLNLVVNARDAMPDGGAITITAEVARSDGQDWVQIDVSDNGPGMSPEHLLRASAPYFTTKKAGQGTGLGLTMVKTFVDRQEGVLDLQSNLGAGTRVRLLLPA